MISHVPVCRTFGGLELKYSNQSASFSSNFRVDFNDNPPSWFSMAVQINWIHFVYHL